MDFGIYVHIPFCVHKCSYCDFYSFTEYGSYDFEALQSALLREISGAAQWWNSHPSKGTPVTSLFFGGGTPSIYPPALLSELIRCLREHFQFSERAEITVEANPETVTRELLEAYRNTPINRISLGAQSFQAEHLKTLERLGSAESIERAVGLLKEAGFSNFNLDLIFGIPNQSQSEFIYDIQRAAALGPTHLSFYQLTLKPKHPLYQALLDPDVAAENYEQGVATLKGLGYFPYEISNFSKTSFECQHNLLYWNGGDFLGVGPSASSRVFLEGCFYHRKQRGDYKRYLSDPSFGSVPFEATTLKQTQLEATFLELRKNVGISLERFESLYQLPLRQARKLPLFIEGGLVCLEGDRLWLTDKGRLLVDSIAPDLV